MDIISLSDTPTSDVHIISTSSSGSVEKPPPLLQYMYKDSSKFTDNNDINKNRIPFRKNLSKPTKKDQVCNSEVNTTDSTERCPVSWYKNSPDKSQVNFIITTPENYCSPSPNTKVTSWINKYTMSPLTEQHLTHLTASSFGVDGGDSDNKSSIILRRDYKKDRTSSVNDNFPLFPVNRHIPRKHFESKLTTVVEFEDDSNINPLKNSKISSLKNVEHKAQKTASSISKTDSIRKASTKREKTVVSARENSLTPSILGRSSSDSFETAKMEVTLTPVVDPQSPESKNKEELCSYLKLMTHPLQSKGEILKQNRRSTRVKHLSLLSEKKELERKLNWEAQEIGKKNSRSNSETSEKSAKLPDLRLSETLVPKEHNENWEYFLLNKKKNYLTKQSFLDLNMKKLTQKSTENSLLDLKAFDHDKKNKLGCTDFDSTMKTFMNGELKQRKLKTPVQTIPEEKSHKLKRRNSSMENATPAKHLKLSEEKKVLQTEKKTIFGAKHKKVRKHNMERGVPQLRNQNHERVQKILTRRETFQRFGREKLRKAQPKKIVRKSIKDAEKKEKNSAIRRKIKQERKERNPTCIKVTPKIWETRLNGLCKYKSDVVLEGKFLGNKGEEKNWVDKQMEQGFVDKSEKQLRAKSEEKNVAHKMKNKVLEKTVEQKMGGKNLVEKTKKKIKEGKHEINSLCEKPNKRILECKEQESILLDKTKLNLFMDEPGKSKLGQMSFVDKEKKAILRDKTANKVEENEKAGNGNKIVFGNMKTKIIGSNVEKIPVNRVKELILVTKLKQQEMLVENMGNIRRASVEKSKSELQLLKSLTPEHRKALFESKKYVNMIPQAIPLPLTNSSTANSQNSIETTYYTAQTEADLRLTSPQHSKHAAIKSPCFGFTLDGNNENSTTFGKSCSKSSCLPNIRSLIDKLTENLRLLESATKNTPPTIAAQPTRIVTFSNRATPPKERLNSPRTPSTILQATSCNKITQTDCDGFAQKTTPIVEQNSESIIEIGSSNCSDFTDIAKTTATEPENGVLYLDQLETVNTSQISPLTCHFVPLMETSVVESLHKCLLQPKPKTSRINDYYDNMSPAKSNQQEKRISQHSVNISSCNGPVMNAYYIDFQLVIMQELAVSCWNQSPLGNILGSQNMWVPNGVIRRLVLDNGCVQKESSEMVISMETSVCYVELWTKEHKSERREAPVADIFATVYFWSLSRNEPGRKVLQLENINGFASDVQYVVLKNSRNIIVSWNVITDNVSVTIVHRYNLAVDYQSVISVNQMQSVEHYVSSLHNIDDCDNLMMGWGGKKLTLWNWDFGHIVSTIDLKDAPLPIRYLWTKRDRTYLFSLRHLANGTFQLIAINSSSCEYKQLRIFEPAADYENLQGVCIENGLLVAFYGNGVLCWNMETADLIIEVSSDDHVAFLPSDKHVVIVTNEQIQLRHAFEYLITNYDT